MKKSKFFVVALIGLLMAAGLVLTGCDKPNCPGNGECTVFIEQSMGLYVDTSKERTTCGKGATWNSDQGKYTGGCKVQNMMDNRERKYGSHGCNC